MPEKTGTRVTADEIKQAATSWLADCGFHTTARVIDVSLVQGLVAEIGEQQAALDVAGKALSAYNGIALDVTGLRETLAVEGEPVDWQAVWESVGDLGARCRSFEQGLRKAQRRVAELEAQLRGIDCANGHHSWTEQGRGPCVCGEPAQPLVQPTAEAVTDRG